MGGSGELEFEEFCILAARFLIEEDEEQMKKELKEAFRFYDKDGEGYLTIETLSSILLELEPSLGKDELQDIIDEVDEDGSGTIDFDGITVFHQGFDAIRLDFVNVTLSVEMGGFQTFQCDINEWINNGEEQI